MSELRDSQIIWPAELPAEIVDYMMRNYFTLSEGLRMGAVCRDWWLYYYLLFAKATKCDFAIEAVKLGNLPAAFKFYEQFEARQSDMKLVEFLVFTQQFDLLESFDDHCRITSSTWRQIIRDLTLGEKWPALKELITRPKFKIHRILVGNAVRGSLHSRGFGRLPPDLDEIIRPMSLRKLIKLGEFQMALDVASRWKKTGYTAQLCLDMLVGGDLNEVGSRGVLNEVGSRGDLNEVGSRGGMKSGQRPLAIKFMREYLKKLSFGKVHLSIIQAGFSEELFEGIDLPIFEQNFSKILKHAYIESDRYIINRLCHHHGFDREIGSRIVDGIRNDASETNGRIKFLAELGIRIDLETDIFDLVIKSDVEICDLIPVTLGPENFRLKLLLKIAEENKFHQLSQVYSKWPRNSAQEQDECCRLWNEFVERRNLNGCEWAVANKIAQPKDLLEKLIRLMIIAGESYQRDTYRQIYNLARDHREV
jgi:hypothetical protein